MSRIHVHRMKRVALPPSIVGGGVAQPTLDFHSAWNAGIGATQALVRDNGNWDHNSTYPNGLDVIASTGLDFPCPNVLRVTALSSNNGFPFLRKTSGLAIPAVGQSRWYRQYWRFMLADGLSSGDQHNFQDANSGGACNWQWDFYPIAAGDGLIKLQMRAVGMGNLACWECPPLNKNQTYRTEHQIERTGTSTYLLHARIYTSDNVLLYDDDNFEAEFQLGTFLSDEPELTFNGISEMAGHNVGCNTLDPPWPDGSLYMYQSAIASSLVGWCGAYNADAEGA